MSGQKFINDFPRISKQMPKKKRLPIKLHLLCTYSHAKLKSRRTEDLLRLFFCAFKPKIRHSVTKCLPRLSFEVRICLLLLSRVASYFVDRCCLEDVARPPCWKPRVEFRWLVIVFWPGLYKPMHRSRGYVPSARSHFNMYRRKLNVNEYFSLSLSLSLWRFLLLDESRQDLREEGGIFVRPGYPPISFMRPGWLSELVKALLTREKRFLAKDLVCCQYYSHRTSPTDCLSTLGDAV